jgi:translation initiation factor 2 subunit 3
MIMPQAEINIGLVGHVDHGKTTLTKALSGVWTDKHSEEIRRGISIRLGYADSVFYKCEACKEPNSYSTTETCPKCGAKAKLTRKVSFVDAPGHETLIATMLSGSALMDGVILVISADEECPQPQTKEHLLALKLMGLKNLVVVQNKIDIVDKEQAKSNREQIRAFLKKMGFDVPIIPIAANYNANTDVLIAAIEEFIPTPKRDNSKPLRMYIARSFDINRPGASAKELKGGVLGGSIVEGEVKVGDEIEIRPGIKRTRQNQDLWSPVKTKVAAIYEGEESYDKGTPGGLLALQTMLDPCLTKSDSLSGNVAGPVGSLPEPFKNLDCKLHLIERELIDSDVSLLPNEPLMLSIGTSVTVGIVQKIKGDDISMTLKIPIVASKGDRIAISKRIDMKWRLVGYCEIV